MSNRSYDGQPLDMTWNSGPWANNGETIDATTDDDTGSMTTEDWPEAATPKEELNDDQIAVIETAARNPNVDSPTKLTQLSNVNRSRTYAHSVIRKHWPERYWVGDCEKSTELKNKVEIAEYVREHFLNGGTYSDLQDKHGWGIKRIQNAAKGEGPYSGLDCKTPPIKHTSGNHDGEWVVENNHSKNVESDLSVPLDHVSKVRQRLLDGESTTEIGNDYDVSRKCIRDVAVGNYRYGLVKSPTPPLDYSGRGRSVEYYIPDEKDSKQNSKQDTLPETEATESSEIKPTQRPTSTNDDSRSKTLIYGLATLVGIAFLRWWRK